MAPLVWDTTGDRLYETGVDHGVLYIPDEDGVYATGVPWNGLTSVSENPTGAEGNAQFADNIKYLNLISAEEFGATIEAFTYPDEWAQFDGLAAPTPGLVIGQQNRGVFGLSYRTILGNDLEGNAYGFKIHMVYGCQAAPSEKAYGTVNDSPEAINFSWEVTTTPVPVTGFSPTAILVADSSVLPVLKMTALTEALYGTAEDPATLPTPDEVIDLISP